MGSSFGRCWPELFLPCAGQVSIKASQFVVSHNSPNLALLVSFIIIIKCLLNAHFVLGTLGHYQESLSVCLGDLGKGLQYALLPSSKALLEEALEGSFVL